MSAVRPNANLGKSIIGAKSREGSFQGCITSRNFFLFHLISNSKPIRLCNRLPRDLVGAPSLESFKFRLDAVLGEACLHWQKDRLQLTNVMHLFHS